MSLKSLIRLVQDYLKRHPAPSSAQIFKGLLKLSYVHSTPFTNSKSKKQLLYPIQNIASGNFLQSLTSSLNFDEKLNKIQNSNKFDSISTEEAHEKVIQDPIFGSAKLNQNKDRWIYIAKKKTPKSKSYFLEGSGKNVYAPDLGQLYDQVNDIGIFIWDIKLKKIIPIDIKIQGDQSKYYFSYPIFANDEGTKFICHGYKKTQFGHGLSFCFNRPVDIFQVSIQNLGQQKMKVRAKKLIKRHQTNMFANISPCYNYIVYLGGSDYIHSYYLDLVVLQRKDKSRKNQGSGSESKGEQNLVDGYDIQWKQIHRMKQQFIGSYLTAKTETFIHEGVPYAYYQTTQKGQQIIKCINLQSGEAQQISENKTGESYDLSNIERDTGIVTGKISSHNYNTFFYMKIGENKPIVIPPINQQQFKVQQFNQPIHGYLLQAQNYDQQFKKDKNPLLVLVHGGPHACSDASLTLIRYLFLKCGYSVLLPNYSGSSGFGQQYLKAALGNIGTKDAKEIVQLIDKVLQKKPNIDKQKVYVYGGSYGGYMGAIMGSRYPQHFKAAVILNGVLSIPGNFWFSDIPQWSTAQSIKDSKIHNVSALDYVRMYEQSPISQPMKIPTLQFLGTKDRRVPYRQGLLFDAMTRKAGTPIQTYVYDNSAHNLFQNVETCIDVVLKSMLFLQGLPMTQQKQQQKKQKNEKDNIEVKQDSQQKKQEQIQNKQKQESTEKL